MAKLSIAELEALLNKAAGGLPDTTSKKMFGCHADWIAGASWPKSATWSCGISTSTA